jgi:hypothetical protein
MPWQTTRISPFLKNPEALFLEVIEKLLGYCLNLYSPLLAAQDEFK